VIALCSDIPEPVCPDGLEYRACVKACDAERTCDDYLTGNVCKNDQLKSGCFCKSGLVRKRMGSNECIESKCKYPFNKLVSAVRFALAKS